MNLFTMFVQPNSKNKTVIWDIFLDRLKKLLDKHNITLISFCSLIVSIITKTLQMRSLA